ncbi:MAG: hypothetical protein RQ723_07720 [Desulfuromonadales bacterium]|nr:hypothetical protein [Desulfuromonadales bacterium]
MYLARDKNQDLYDLPSRGRDCWWAEGSLDGSYLKLDKNLYPEVTWESEPLPVRLIKMAEAAAC